MGNAPDSNFEIWRVGEPDWSPRAVRERPGFDGHPSFAPDGSELVFSSHEGDERALLVADLDGGLREIARGGEELDYPVWLPEGILYGRHGYGSGGRWLLDPTTGAVSPFEIGPRVGELDRTRVAVTGRRDATAPYRWSNPSRDVGAPAIWKCRA